MVYYPCAALKCPKKQKNIPYKYMASAVLLESEVKPGLTHVCLKCYKAALAHRGILEVATSRYYHLFTTSIVEMRPNFLGLKIKV